MNAIKKNTIPAQSVKNEFIEKSTSDLIPYAKNARTHSPEQVNQIAASITEFGFTNPVLIDPEGLIIAGHGRVLAAKQLKIKNLPCYILHGLSEAQKRAYTIADNKLALNAGWDYELLKSELTDLNQINYDLDIIGFDSFELNEILSPEEIQPLEGLTDDDDVPQEPKNPISKFGDIWQLGDHRLMCGDSTSISDVKKLMDNKLADMLLTDPPYNVDYIGHTTEKLKIQNDHKSDLEFMEFIKKTYKAADSVLKKGAVFYIWHASIKSYTFRAAIDCVDWTHETTLIWYKGHFVRGRQDYHWQHEPCLYGQKNGANALWTADKYQTTILKFNKPLRNGIHPTMKPVELFEYQMLNNTKGMDAVLDLFGGSGTTIIAAQKHGRKAYLMEIDPHYADVIIQRWQNYTGQEAIHLASGKKYNEISA